jgi:hypothetical protein
MLAFLKPRVRTGRRAKVGNSKAFIAIAAAASTAILAAGCGSSSSGGSSGGSSVNWSKVSTLTASGRTSMTALVKAAEAEGQLNVITLPSNPKIGELVARGSARRSAAEPGGVIGCWSGCAFEDDCVAEGFELADIAAAAAVGIDAGVVEV